MSMSNINSHEQLNNRPPSYDGQQQSLNGQQPPPYNNYEEQSQDNQQPPSYDEYEETPQGHQQPPPYLEVDITNVIDERDNNNNNNVNHRKIEFNDNPIVQDVWAIFVFFLMVIGTLVIAGISIPNIDMKKMYGSNSKINITVSTYSYSYSYSYSYGSQYDKRNENENENEHVSNTTDIIIMLISSFSGSAFLALIYLILIQIFAEKMVKGIVIFSILLNILYGIIIFSCSPVMFGFMLIIALAYVIYFFFSRNNILFGQILLKTIIPITRKYPAIILVGFIGTIIATIWYGFITFTLIASMTYIKETSGIIAIIVYLFLIFSFFFSAQVINNTIHFITSGVLTAYYYNNTIDPDTENILINEKNPTLKYFKRAIVTSFGSICFGSILIHFIGSLGTFVRKTKTDVDNNKGCDCCILYIIGWGIKYLLSWIDDGLRHFDMYSITEIAVSGKSCRQSSKDTWAILESRGIEKLIDDNIIDNILGIGSFCVGCLSSIITCGIGFIVMNIGNTYELMIYGFISFFIGFRIFSVSTKVIKSSVATIFVCLCKYPDSIQHIIPELWNIVKKNYSNIVSY
ncbi:hypothetical protein BCR32DRAFT_304158 [Anaeromyces robustus]|uniref:Protein PNS1 n=1 Tax=Anaeromyces robustus TaxID=1754192 RepID=A0A1Y1XJN8_9FUNG|nr:hypothetical protein BCR32DRAFT_304158 [Anaeromyces robustus]|eukprot:ORX85666.1 hypothetical protein BCR32DRAFT_304158 [Anaeromyces robustus]